MGTSADNHHFDEGQLFVKITRGFNEEMLVEGGKIKAILEKGVVVELERSTHMLRN